MINNTLIAGSVSEKKKKTTKKKTKKIMKMDAPKDCPDLVAPPRFRAWVGLPPFRVSAGRRPSPAWVGAWRHELPPSPAWEGRGQTAKGRARMPWRCREWKRGLPRFQDSDRREEDIVYVEEKESRERIVQTILS